MYAWIRTRLNTCHTNRDAAHGLPDHIRPALHHPGLGISALGIGWRKPRRLGHPGGHAIAYRTLSNGLKSTIEIDIF